ncbi:hypothetical protein DL93DRAFT_411836 [Clavulina sp. PMI_390]|nr:hypothetical protein DL93DRAFT_411836 [Clavulina sp. PMI_390]
MSVLAKGAACFRCRKHKEKCDAAKPICSRCKSLYKECAYPTGIARRRPLTEVLEARALELEIMIHKLTLGSAYDLNRASDKLLKRIRNLGDTVRNLQASALASTTVVEYNVNPHQWAGLDALPMRSSLDIIDLFIPHREHYYFFVDVPYFLHCAARPPSHPESLHPCLLNACYLAACASNQGELAVLKPYFLHRTRYFLQQALMLSDRITHFLWASIIFGCFLAQERRLEESFAVVGAAGRFAVACGLCVPNVRNAHGIDDLDNAAYILPPPKDEAEMIDRIRVAHSLYLLDQTLPVLGKYVPSFPYDERWASITNEPSPGHQNDQDSVSNEKQQSKHKHTTYVNVSMARTFERVTNFYRSVHEHDKYSLDEYTDLSDQIVLHQSRIPPLSGLSRGRASVADGPGPSRPDLLLVHTTLYGSGLILHSARAENDVNARRDMLRCVQALVYICEDIRAHQHIHKVRIGYVNLVHMVNAIRVIASDLRRPETRKNVQLSARNCRDIELFLDFIEELAYPYCSGIP